MNKPLAHEPNLFTNSQIRDIAGQRYLQPQELYTIGEAISTLLTEDNEDDEPCRIVIATDTRTSSIWIKEALIKGLAANDVEIYDAGICPTPFVAKALKDYQPSSDNQDDEDEHDDFDDAPEDTFFTLGIVITASHNPAEYNGIKILTSFGYLTPELEADISEIYYDLMQVPADIPKHMPYCINLDLVSFYETQVLQQLQHTPLSSISVVLDCAHGATSIIAPRIFKAAGCTVATINNSLDGSKINQNSSCSNPQLLLNAIAENKTDWGCAFDGDGDRVIIAHKSGKIYDGDDLLVLLSLHPDYQEYKTLVGTFMTNQGVVEFAKQHHKNLVRTQVGERNVIQALTHHQAMIGSETCGHITVMSHAFCSDGIFTALLFFDTITGHQELTQDLYKKYPQVHATIPLKGKTLDTKTIGSIVSEYQNASTRIVVRPSNTEPILRIMVEHQDLQQAQNILEILKKLFTNALV